MPSVVILLIPNFSMLSLAGAAKQTLKFSLPASEASMRITVTLSSNEVKTVRV